MTRLLSGISDFVGLDIGTTALRMVQLHGTGRVRTLDKYAYAPIDNNISLSDSPADEQKLIRSISQLIASSGITTKNVAVGLPSEKVFTTVVDIDRLPPAELASSIRYQADSLIPTPMSESKIDWALLGNSPKDETKVEIILTSVGNKFIEKRLDLLESIGLNVIGFEPDSVALTRAVVPEEMITPQLIIDIGTKATDLIIVNGGTPRLTRAIPTGSEAIVRSAVQHLDVDQHQAEQYVFKFGMSKDKLEGQVLQAISSTIDVLVVEIEKSLKFFHLRYGADQKIERIIVVGAAATLPEFPLYLANKFGVNVEIGNAWRNVSFPVDRQNELLVVSNFFCVAAGLAERNE